MTAQILSHLQGTRQDFKDIPFKEAEWYTDGIQMAAALSEMAPDMQGLW